MNSLANKVNLIGRLGATPEMTQTDKGNQLVRFNLAVDASFKDKDGKWNNQTHWHSIKAWGKTAELIHKTLQKGQKVMIEGKLVNNTYEKDGEKRVFTNIEINNFLVLSHQKN